LKDVLPVLLQFTENFQGSCEFFIWSGHRLLCLCTLIATCNDKFILLFFRKSIALWIYK
jgi:hypothetical protein